MIWEPQDNFPHAQRIVSIYLFYDRGLYRIETSAFIRPANQWIGFCKIRTSVKKSYSFVEGINSFRITLQRKR